MWQADQILGSEVGSTAPLFLAVLAVHVPAGLTAVLAGRSIVPADTAVRS